MEEENQRLREQVAKRDEKIRHQDSLLCQQSLLMQQMQAQIAGLDPARERLARSAGQR